MSAAIDRPIPARTPVLEWAAVGAGFALLLVRSSVIAWPTAPLVLLGMYGALAWMSVGGSARPKATAMADPLRWGVLAVGLAAVAGAAALAGPRPPSPVTAWALPLGAAAAVAEEAFFRGLLYRVLSPAGAAITVAVSALAFAAIHVPAYGLPAFWVDLGAGVLLSWQRWASGGWGVPAATHVAANLLAVMR